MRLRPLALACLLLSGAPAWSASLGSAFTYQGNLNFNGSPASGNFDFQFALYTVATGGTAVDTLTLANQTVTEGLINASLDYTDVPFNGQALWIEVHVRPAGSGTYTTLSPRQSLTATPYALFALSGNQGPAGPKGATGSAGATGATGLTGPAGSTGAQGATGATGPMGSVALPFAQTISSGSPGLAVTNSGDGLNGSSSSASNTGVYGNNTGGGKGVFGASATGQGVVGQTTSGSGVVGQSSTGSGVYGATKGVSGANGAAGVWGNTHDYYGVWGTSVVGDGVHGNSTTASGVYGLSASGAGAWGESTGYDGVHGHTSNANGNTSGVAGFGDGSNNGVFGVSTSGNGVYGGSTSGNGVEGNADGPDVSGVYGQATNLYGFGVFGRNTAGGYGVATDGPVQQARSQGGWVKAMVYAVPVNLGGHGIVRCFNSQLPASLASTPPCGFVYGEPTPGLVTVDFGFKIDDRFVSVTPSTLDYSVAVGPQSSNVVGMSFSHYALNCSTDYSKVPPVTTCSIDHIGRDDGAFNLIVY